MLFAGSSGRSGHHDPSLGSPVGAGVAHLPGKGPREGGLGELSSPYYSLSPTGPDGFLGEEKRPRPALGPPRRRRGPGCTPPRAEVSRAGVRWAVASPLLGGVTGSPGCGEPRRDPPRERQVWIGGGGLCQGLMRRVRGWGRGMNGVCLWARGPARTRCLR